MEETDMERRARITQMYREEEEKMRNAQEQRARFLIKKLSGKV